MELLHPSPEGVLLGLVLVSAWGVLFLLYQIIKSIRSSSSGDACCSGWMTSSGPGLLAIWPVYGS